MLQDQDDFTEEQFEAAIKTANNYEENSSHMSPSERLAEARKILETSIDGLRLKSVRLIIPSILCELSSGYLRYGDITAGLIAYLCEVANAKNALEAENQLRLVVENKEHRDGD